MRITHLATFDLQTRQYVCNWTKVGSVKPHGKIENNKATTKRNLVNFYGSNCILNLIV